MINNKKGFTITEILVVIAIIGIILAISIPSIINIRKRSNERLLESKKDIILVAAELYAKDKNIPSGKKIFVYNLVENGYVNSEIANGSGKCGDAETEKTSKGCVIDPTNNQSLNNQEILIKYSNDAYIAIWGGEQASTTDTDLVGKVKTDLKCTDENQKVEKMKCVYCANDTDCNNPNNYLYYSGIMWRVIGVYKIDDKEVAKMVTDDTVTWDTENDTNA